MSPATWQRSLWLFARPRAHLEEQARKGS